MKTAFNVARRADMPSLQRQRGVTLIIALIVLVAMTLAGLALVRSVDSATLLAGNLAFRQSAEASADEAMETAIGVVRGMTSAALIADGASGSGYFAELPAADVDFTGSATTTTGDDFDWSTAATISADTAGNSAAYVIHRLCQAAGALSATTCTTWQVSSTPVSGEGIVVAGEGYGDAALKGTPTVMRGLYRITVRISGPRNTYSYVQAIVIV